MPQSQPTPRSTSKSAGIAWYLRKPAELTLADWLEDLAVYGTGRNPIDLEIGYQLSLAIKNRYLVREALRGKHPTAS